MSLLFSLDASDGKWPAESAERSAHSNISGFFLFLIENNPEAIEAIKREANLVSMWQENITLVEEIVVDEPLCKSRRCY